MADETFETQSAPTASESLTDTKSSRYGDERVKKGPLMAEFEPGSEEEKEVAKFHLLMWEQQDSLLDQPAAQWGVNAYRRAGISNAKLLRSKSRDQDKHWTAWAPKNATPDAIPGVNKAATLCRRLTAMLTIDPFKPQVVAENGDDTKKAAAELSQRVLESLQDEHGLNEPVKQRRAIDKSHTYGSGYIEYFVDQRGGGEKAVKVQARPDAIHADLALIDPITGAEGPMQDANGGPIPYVDRFVDEEGNFVEDPEEAAVEYIAKLDSEVLDSRHVRLLPHTSADIWDADGVMIAAMPTWAEVKEMEPDIAGMDDEIIAEIMGFRPSFADALTDADTTDIDPKIGESDEWNDERPVFVLKSYHLRRPEYPDGLMLITIGGCYVLHRSRWIDDSDGEKRALSLPVTQLCGLAEGREGYWHVGLMEVIGGSNEQRAAIMAHWNFHLDHFARRKTYLPTNSIINPDQIRNPTATVLPINPGGKPEYEDIPEFPSDAVALYQEQGMAMDDAAGLNTQPGPKTTSGRHEFALISQEHAGMAEFRSNYERGYIRGSRITLELARAFFTDEQETKYAGEGGSYRLLAWKGADLVVDPDVRVKAGSGTMLAPAAKAQLAERYAGLGVIDMDDLKEVITSNVGADIGLQDNPHRMRVLNQIAEWKEGPPPDWQPPEPQIDPMTGQPAMDPATGQPLTPPDPVLMQIWEPIMADELPPVASMRLKELADAMAGPKYRTFPPEWRFGLDTEYQHMGMVLTQSQMPAPDPTGGQPGQQGGDGGKDVPGLEAGGEANDLQEDALQEGAPPEMVT